MIYHLHPFHFPEMPSKKFLALIFLLTATFWEHGADITQHEQAKPSYLLHECYLHILKPLWTTLGEWCAYVSSYLHIIWENLADLFRWLKLERYFDNVVKLALIIFEVCFSFCHMVQGYFEVVKEYKYMILVPMGTVLLIIVPLCYWSHKRKWVWFSSTEDSEEEKETLKEPSRKPIPFSSSVKSTAY